MLDLPNVKLFPTSLIDDMHKAFFVQSFGSLRSLIGRPR